MSSTKFVFFGSIGKQRWSSCRLIGRYIFDFYSESTEWSSMKLDRKQDLNVLYQVCVFRAEQKTKMAALANSSTNKRRSRGGGTGGLDPLRFVRGGVLCIGLMGRRGGPTVVLPYYYLFFGSLCSPVLRYTNILLVYIYVHVYCKTLIIRVTLFSRSHHP